MNSYQVLFLAQNLQGLAPALAVSCQNYHGWLMESTDSRRYNYYNLNINLGLDKFQLCHECFFESLYSYYLFNQLHWREVPVVLYSLLSKTLRLSGGFLVSSLGD